MGNIYYSPEKFGLEVVGELEYSDAYYQFDTRVVWRHKESGQFYTARDSGCSCPTPFEDYTSIESLEPLDLVALEREAREEVREGYSDSKISDYQRLVEKVRSLQ